MSHDPGKGILPAFYGVTDATFDKELGEVIGLNSRADPANASGGPSFGISFGICDILHIATIHGEENPAITAWFPYPSKPGHPTRQKVSMIST